MRCKSKNNRKTAFVRDGFGETDLSNGFPAAFRNFAGLKKTEWH